MPWRPAQDRLREGSDGAAVVPSEARDLFDSGERSFVATLLRRTFLVAALLGMDGANGVENVDVGNAVFVAEGAPEGVLAAVSERGSAPAGTASPTGFLARRFADSLGHRELPIVRATQVHGRRVVEVEEKPAPGETADAGPCDALVTRLAGVGLVVQTADCVPVLLAASDAVGAVHTGWRGAAANVAGAAAESLLALTGDRRSVRAWLGPAIGACCYEVGDEVAALFGGEFVRATSGGRHRLDLRAVVRSQLESAGISAESVVTDLSCTRCGGERFASYRRDRENAGRMIALVARFGGRMRQ